MFTLQHMLATCLAAQKTCAIISYRMRSFELDVILLDSITVLLETGDTKAMVNNILMAQSMAESVIVRTELDNSYEDENRVFGWLTKRADIVVLTKAISFISKEIHGKLIVQDNSKDSFYQRHYFIKDRQLQLKAVGL